VTRQVLIKVDTTLGACWMYPEPTRQPLTQQSCGIGKGGLRSLDHKDLHVVQQLVSQARTFFMADRRFLALSTKAEPAT
jgi:hypothetical protein